MAEKNADAILRALAANQANSLNSSPFSQAVNNKLNQSISSVASALMAPGNALRGDYNYAEINPDGSVNPFNGALLQQANNMAGVVGVSAMGIPRPTASLGMGGVPSPTVNNLLEAARARMAARAEKVNSIIQSGQKNVKFSGPNGMAMASPDMSRPSGYRLTYFDPKGVPNGHFEFDSFDKAIEQAIREGFSPK